MSDLHVIGGVKKLNNQNYKSWSTRMMLYLQGQNLWEVPTSDMMRKWKIKVGKSMCVLKMTIEKDALEHIRDAKTP
uniref:DUF4219 domain-containing protein n=1 Tax=Gossypium raimondii TaxID=29730 RepID=A0A0D2V2X8_GOSRA|nr:hypothetical protein B456_012G076500 [Gossypium raimondii]